VVQEAFWREMASPQTGHDDLTVESAEGIDGSLFASDAYAHASAACPWSAGRISASAGCLLAHARPVPAPAAPKLSHGMLFSAKYWKVAEGNLFVAHYNHAGASHTWYSVRAKHSGEVEAVLQEQVWRLCKYPSGTSQTSRSKC
jgi:JmjC domain, hydroxylase